MTSLKILTNQICLFPSYKWVICSLLGWIKHIKNCEAAQDLNSKAPSDASVTRQISPAEAFYFAATSLDEVISELGAV